MMNEECPAEPKRKALKKKKVDVKMVNINNKLKSMETQYKQVAKKD